MKPSYEKGSEWWCTGQVVHWMWHLHCKGLQRLWVLVSGCPSCEHILSSPVVKNRKHLHSPGMHSSIASESWSGYPVNSPVHWPWASGHFLLHHTDLPHWGPPRKRTWAKVSGKYTRGESVGPTLANTDPLRLSHGLENCPYEVTWHNKMPSQNRWYAPIKVSCQGP